MQSLALGVIQDRPHAGVHPIGLGSGFGEFMQAPSLLRGEALGLLAGVGAFAQTLKVLEAVGVLFAEGAGALAVVLRETPELLCLLVSESKVFGRIIGGQCAERFEEDLVWNARRGGAAIAHAADEGSASSWGAIALDARTSQRGVVVVLAPVRRISADGGA